MKMICLILYLPDTYINVKLFNYRHLNVLSYEYDPLAANDGWIAVNLKPLRHRA